MESNATEAIREGERQREVRERCGCGVEKGREEGAELFKHKQTWL
jgi:hypothetical protein